MKQLIRFVLRHVPRRYIQRVVHLCTPLVGLFYAGSRVQCPVCGNRYRKFMPYGYVNSRENALCPHCQRRGRSQAAISTGNGTD